MPRVIRDILFRAAIRVGVPLNLVANHALPIPNSPLIRNVQVAQGFDVADNLIAERVGENDLVVTSDIPLAAEVIEPAIRQIRSQTPNGTINMNTNGSRPEVLKQLFDAGLDSIRVSMNSVREACYQAYFRPTGYRFGDVLESIAVALAHKKFVAINYLNSPGFTDTPQEIEALTRFLDKYPIHMIQWRNLNFDPIRYWREMNAADTHGEPIGVGKLLNRIRKQFPKLEFGYFNPPKENFGKKL